MMMMIGTKMAPTFTTLTLGCLEEKQNLLDHGKDA